MKPARLLVFQALRNPSSCDRELLTLLAEGHTHKQAAGHLVLAHRSVTNALAPCAIATPRPQMKP